MAGPVALAEPLNKVTTLACELPAPSVKVGLALVTLSVGASFTAVAVYANPIGLDDMAPVLPL